MIRTFVVGDVHGCIDELGLLVERLAPQVGDKFVFLGDLVDKGPNSLAVVRYVRNLLERFPGSTCIAGNHEEKALRLYFKALEKKDTSVLPADEPWMTEATAGDMAFLATLPLVYRMPEYQAIAVHGGFYPKFFVDYPDGIGEIPALWHKGGGKKMDRARKFLRVRTVGTDGGMVQLGQEDATTVQWADVYDGREGFAFYGHEPFESVRESRHAMGLDTSCVFGGCLTAAVLRTGTLKESNGQERQLTDIELVQVSALKKYKDRLVIDPVGE
jgi:diadenosine tetraphosphatase ApaH/serine/threonine PP2A family protein phosphatase